METFAQIVGGGIFIFALMAIIVGFIRIITLKIKDKY